MLKKRHSELAQMFDQMVEWRRHFHQYPELSFQEVETPRMIAEILEGFGIEVRRNVGGRGVVGKIYGAKPGKTIALRADFDALPIQDEKDVPYNQRSLVSCMQVGMMDIPPPYEQWQRFFKIIETVLQEILYCFISMQKRCRQVEQRR